MTLSLNKNSFDHSPQLTNRQILTLVLAIAAIMISSLDIYIPAAIELAKEFNVDDYIIKLTFATGPLSSFIVCIPVGYYSDLFGRRNLYIYSMICFIIGAAMAMLAPSIEFFFLGRFLLSIGSGSLSVLSGAIIADIFTGRELAKYMGAYAAIFPAVFTLAPLLGAQLLDFFGWRSIFAFLFLSMGILGLIIGPRMPETRHFQQPIKKASNTITTSDSLWNRLVIVFENPRMVVLGITNALPISIGALFIFNSPFLFIETFGFSPQGFSILVASPVLCQFFGALAYRSAVQRIGPLRGLIMGQYPCYILITLVGIMLSGFLPEDPYLIIGIMCLYSFGSTWIISSSITLLLDSTEQDKGLVNSVISLLRNGVIFIILTSASYFVHDSIIPIFITMVAIALLILILIRVSIRQNSRQEIN